MSVPLDIRDFAKLFRNFTRSAFRLETLDVYSVPEEKDSYQRFLRGEAPPASHNEEWCGLIRENIEAGKTMERVHIVPSPLPPYLKFEIDWGYVHGIAAGEKVQLLERTQLPEEMSAMKDFWLFDDDTLVLMRYDEEGRFLGAELEREPKVVAQHVRVRARLLSLSLPLEQYLVKHRTA